MLVVDGREPLTNGGGLGIYPTLSSPLVDSASSMDSAGAWMDTDLSARMLMSRLFERCLSLLSLEKKIIIMKRSEVVYLYIFFLCFRQETVLSNFLSWQVLYLSSRH